MEILQKSLEWAYIGVCFAIIWFSVAAIHVVWDVICGKFSGKKTLSTLFSLAVVFFVAWVIVRMGMFVDFSTKLVG